MSWDPRELELALVVVEADQALIEWTAENRKVVLAINTGNQRTAQADRELYCTKLLLSRSAEAPEDPVFDLYVIQRPFAITPAEDVSDYPLPVAGPSVYTATLGPADGAHQKTAIALAVDAQEHRGTYESATVRGAPFVVSIRTAEERYDAR